MRVVCARRGCVVVVLGKSERHSLKVIGDIPDEFGGINILKGLQLVFFPL